MEFETKRFGTVTLEDADTFAVPNGIPGFPQLRRVALLGAAGALDDDDVSSDDEPILFWMQDIDDGCLAFLCIVPWDVFPGYDVEFDEHEMGIHGDVRVLNLVTVHRTGDQPEQMTANLRAPLLVDVSRRRIQQIILPDSRWPIGAPITTAHTSGAL
ncbi:MAG: hypothetical protein JWN62_2247 [Acidimicrobiales bacterium]|nr:hypothetical protein [Acidimicrobiales bacterium]